MPCEKSEICLKQLSRATITARENDKLACFLFLPSFLSAPAKTGWKFLEVEYAK